VAIIYHLSSATGNQKRLIFKGGTRVGQAPIFSFQNFAKF